MTRIVALFLATMIWAGVARAADWTRTDSAFQIASSALIVADWAQTREIAKHPERWRETNLILGEHPSRGKVNAYFAACLVGNAAIAYALPAPYRRWWQIATVVVEAGYVAHNYHLGIRVSF